MQITTIKLLHL